MGLSLLAVVLIMRLWVVHDLRVPFGLAGDTMPALAGIKSVNDFGWMYTNASLGWPGGQEIYDFGVLGFDNGSWLIIKLMTLGAESPGTVINAYFLLGFPLVALSAFLALRGLGVRWGTAIVIAVLFSVLPGHFSRGLSHLFLGASWSVPIGCYLALSVLLGRELFARRAAGGRPVLRWLSRRTLITFALCALVASGGIYLVAFTLMLLLVAALAPLFDAEGRRDADDRGRRDGRDLRRDGLQRRCRR